MRVAFIDDHRERFGVEPICAARCCRSPRRRTFGTKAERRDPTRRSARSISRTTTRQSSIGSGMNPNEDYFFK
jgi:hypothetical protein